MKIGVLFKFEFAKTKQFVYSAHPPIPAPALEQAAKC